MNDTDSAKLSVNVLTWLPHAALKHPKELALCWKGGCWDFSQLISAARELAEHVEQWQLPPAILALQTASGRQAALALYATLILRRPLLLLKTSLPTDTCKALCTQTAPSVLIRMGEDDSVQPIDINKTQKISHDTRPVVDLNALRLIVPTSGSGGTPKLVMLTDDNLTAAVTASKSAIPLCPGDLWLACMPLAHIGGLSILLRCLEAGAGVMMHENFDPARVWQTIREARVTHVSFVPAMLHQVLEAAAGQRPPDQLRAVLVGGAALDPSLARRAHASGWPLCVSYGMSETASQIATLCGAGAGAQTGMVGRALVGFEVRLEGVGNTGEIALRGPALMAGYATPGLKQGIGLTNGWLKTGDIGQMDAEDNLRLLGRSDDMLLSGGEKVYPAEVEPILRSTSGVSDAALSAVSDPVWGHRLVAVFSGQASIKELEEYCRRHLEGARRPRRFLKLELLPYSATGKLDRQALRRMVAELLADD